MRRRRAPPGAKISRPRCGCRSREAVTGTERSLSVTRPGRCPKCKGSGHFGKPGTCKTCGGSGKIRQGRGPLSMTSICPTCGGSGKVAPPCDRCGGSGRVEETTRVTVKIPPGVQTGSQVRVPGQGAAGILGGPPGDLFLEVQVDPHPIVRREGDDLYVPLPVTVPEAMLGAQVRAPTFTGEVTLTVPPHSQSGRKLRLKGQGVPVAQGQRPGRPLLRAAHPGAGEDHRRGEGRRRDARPRLPARRARRPPPLSLPFGLAIGTWATKGRGRARRKRPVPPRRGGAAPLASDAA